MENKKENLMDVNFTGEVGAVRMVNGDVISIDPEAVEAVYVPEPIEVNSLAEALALNDLGDDVRVITPARLVFTLGELRDSVKNFDYANSPMATKVVSKRQEAINFISAKDKVKFDFKKMLRDCLGEAKDSVEIIRAIYKIRVLNKEFKFLNVNAKRIALNNYLNNKLMAHSAATEEETVSILTLIRNDNNILDYSVLLKVVFEKAINQKVKLY